MVLYGLDGLVWYDMVRYRGVYIVWNYKMWYRDYGMVRFGIVSHSGVYMVWHKIFGIV